LTNAGELLPSELADRLAEEVHLRQIAAIVESSDDAIIGNTLDGTITSWNPAAVRIYGYSAAEAIGQSIEMLVPDALRGDVPGILAQVQAGDRVEQYETGRTRKDGTVIDVWLTISGVKDSSGAIVGASTIARDINERLRGVEALHQSEDSYRALFERHPGPMWLYDLDSLRFLTVNEAAVASYGYSREEFLAMTIEAILAPEDETALAEAREASQGQSTKGWDRPNVGRHRRKDGTFLDVLVSSDSIEFEGREAGLVLAQDMTEQRGLEEQLRQGQKMEAIGNLAGGIAHDFNNLLLVIRGYSANLLKQLTEEDLRDSAQQIDRAAQRASEFTHQLLAFSRQQVLRPEVIDLNTVVAETLALLQRSFGGNIQIESRLEAALEPVLVDRGQIAQAVLNLAINARDAMSESGGTLNIRTANVDLDEVYANAQETVVAGTYVVLQITDSGTGMDKETQRCVFDPFFTTKEEGTGLGLATVYGLVKQSGGHIWLYSEPGMGTTFKLYFPTTRAELTLRSESSSPTTLTGNEVILLVEDTEMVRALVTATLKSYGYAVLVAASGPEAIEVAGQAHERIDLLMTDVVMPRMTGRELADQLVATRPGLKVLFTSGYPSDTVLRHGIAEARTAFIEKPYLPEDLARKVREILDHRPIV
jgi:two-component system cell cycle sensor histidine kinase/response regulator CckA